MFSFEARRRAVLVIAASIGVVVMLAYCSAPRGRPSATPAKPPAATGGATLDTTPRPLASAAVASPPPRYTAVDSQRFHRAASLAWRQFSLLWNDRTGLANATPDYGKLTSWDIGSILAAIHSAYILGLIDDDGYDRRITKTLTTIGKLPLYRHVTYHRMYSAAEAKMVSRGGGITSKGYGWSATDIGRLLLWLRIVADNDPRHRALATAAARRIRMDSVVAGGYLHGEDIGSSGRVRRFQEGRIGYEQYAATGFAMWGADVAPALDVERNARPVEVEGATLLADTRGLDRIVSEPFILLGIEYGWTPAYRRLALEVLRAQENHAARTGKLVFASEDAVSIKPFYFYYYCVYCSGRPFVVETSDPGKPLEGPRWMSTKTVFGWHALAPSGYTRRGVEAIQKAASEKRGWSSGLLEKGNAPSYTFDINTAAVILEAAAYASTGRPLAQWRSGTSVSATGR